MSETQGSVSVLRLDINSRLCPNELLESVEFAVFDRVENGSHALEVAEVDVCPKFAKFLDSFALAVARRIEDCRLALSVLQIYLSLAFRQEPLDDLQISIACGVKQGSLPEFVKDARFHAKLEEECFSHLQGDLGVRDFRDGKHQILLSLELSSGDILVGFEKLSDRI